jgi:rare lipoprotein A
MSRWHVGYCGKSRRSKQKQFRKMKKQTWLASLSIVALAIAACTSTPELAKAKAQSGKASWYGSGLQGRKTASGERFNMNTYSAAHRTHAFGTKLCVENLRNGRGVIVRVNDRGPFVRGRVVDVSRKAAQSLGMIGSGTAAVRISVIGSKQKAGRRC